MTEDQVVSLRPVEPADLPTVRLLNSAAVPAVNDLSSEELALFAEVAHTFLVVVLPRGSVVGFLVGLDGPGVAYDSVNYRWFSERYDCFLYVDRVVVDPAGPSTRLSSNGPRGIRPCAPKSTSARETRVPWPSTTPSASQRSVNRTARAAVSGCGSLRRRSESP